MILIGLTQNKGFKKQQQMYYCHLRLSDNSNLVVAKKGACSLVYIMSMPQASQPISINEY